MKKTTEKPKITTHIKFFLKNLFSLKTFLRFVFYNIFVTAIGHTFYYAREIFTDKNPYGIPCFLYAQISCAIVIALAIVVSTCIGTYHIEAKGGNVTSKGTMHSMVQLNGNNEMFIFFHEAGHAVMAYLQGAINIDVITSCEPYRTISEFPSDDDISTLKKSILVGYAGAAAEEIMYGKYRAGSLVSEDSDFQKVTEKIKAYIVMTNPSFSKTFLDQRLNEEVIAQSKLFYEEAQTLLLEHKFFVLALAKELCEKRSMSYEEITACLKKVVALHPRESDIKQSTHEPPYDDTISA